MPYWKHLSVAWLGIGIACFLVSMVLFISHLAFLERLLFSGPIFIGNIACALYLGYRNNRLVPTRAPLWVWVLPLILLGLEMHGFFVQPVDNGWQGVWNNFFGRGCSSSDCLEEYTLAAPFYASVAYALAAGAAYMRFRRRIIDPEHS